MGGINYSTEAVPSLHSDIFFLNTLGTKFGIMNYNQHKINDILRIASDVIPEWKDKIRTYESVFARKLMMIRLKEEGFTNTKIAWILGMKQSNVSIHLAKKIDERFLSPSEKEMLRVWNNAFISKDLTPKYNKYADYLAQQLLNELSTTKVQIIKKDGKISLEIG